MQVDVEGRVVGTGHTTRLIWPGKVTCPDDPLESGFVDALGFTAQPGMAMAVGFYDAWRLDFTGDGCGRTPWAPKPYPSGYIYGVGVDGQGLVHVSTIGSVLVYDQDGTMVAGYEPCKDVLNCAASTLGRCYDDMCVLDFNARRINRFKGDGTVAATLDLLPLYDQWDLLPTAFGSNATGDMVLLMSGYGGPYDGKEVILHADKAP